MDCQKKNTRMISWDAFLKKSFSLPKWGPSPMCLDHKLAWSLSPLYRIFRSYCTYGSLYLKQKLFYLIISLYISTSFIKMSSPDMQRVDLSLIPSANSLLDTLGTKFVFISSVIPSAFLPYTQRRKKNTHTYIHMCLFVFWVGSFKHSVQCLLCISS